MSIFAKFASKSPQKRPYISARRQHFQKKARYVLSSASGMEDKRVKRRLILKTRCPTAIWLKMAPKWPQMALLFFLLEHHAGIEMRCHFFNWDCSPDAELQTDIGFLKIPPTSGEVWPFLKIDIFLSGTVLVTKLKSPKYCLHNTSTAS